MPVNNSISIISSILKERDEMKWEFVEWAGGVIKQLKSFNNWFHEIPSIIEVLSLFDSFNYCYNTFLFNLFIPFMKWINQIKMKVIEFWFVDEWMDGMVTSPAPSLHYVGCGEMGYKFCCREQSIPSPSFINWVDLLKKEVKLIERWLRENECVSLDWAGNS